MHQPSPPHDAEPNRSSRTYLLVIAVLIVLGFAAFLVVRPHPGGGRTVPTRSSPSTPTTTPQ